MKDTIPRNKRYYQEEKIRRLITFASTEVKLACDAGRYDTPVISENIVLPLLKSALELTHLKNLNNEKANFPGIDLCDRINKVGIQVTAQNNNEKISSTLSKFFRYGLENSFERLIIFILTEKKESYQSKKIDNEIKDGFDFIPSRDIIDYSDIVKIASKSNDRKCYAILKDLENAFEVGPIRVNPDPPTNEILNSNLVSIKFPNILWMAPLLDEAKPKGNWKRGDTRNAVWSCLKRNGLGFSSEWIVFEKKLITFHDLSNYNLPLSCVIDTGAAESIGSTEFSEIDGNYENVFKSLLHFCLQNILYQKKVIWNNKEKIFYFAKNEDGFQDRIEKWTGEVAATRTVCKAIPDLKDTSKIFNYKQLSFKTRFLSLSDNWYLQILPDWFISINGHTKSPFSAKRVSWLKKKEMNQHVSNHFRFIHSFLQEKDAEQVELFGDDHSINSMGFIKVGDILYFDKFPQIDDELWAKNKNDTDSEFDEYNDSEFDLWNT